MQDRKLFFKYIIPSIFSFTLAGVYEIVDGYFVGNKIGDVGLSAINIAYPIVAVVQSIGTGIGMGGAVHYSICKAEGNERDAKEYFTGSLVFMLCLAIILTGVVYCGAVSILKILGAQGESLVFGTTYIRVIALGTLLQMFGTGLVPFMRNFGGSFCAMIAMVSGFATNIILDYTFVWVQNRGIYGAALATIMGQGITIIIAIIYIIYRKNFTFKFSFQNIRNVITSICKVGLAPFGLALAPNITLVLVNRFSVFYDGQRAVATYACIAYIIYIMDLILQGIGDGSQPLISRYYGEKDFSRLKSVQNMSFRFSVMLSLIGVVIIFLGRYHIGSLFGTSGDVNEEIAKIMPIFLLSVPVVAVTRIITSSFYATEKNANSYFLTFIEPILMLVMMLILPPIFGGQIMIWWSTVLARIFTMVLALLLYQR
ncbi:MAG: MATE family efflux transporter [Coprococcus sp.]